MIVVKTVLLTPHIISYDKNYRLLFLMFGVFGLLRARVTMHTKGVFGLLRARFTMHTKSQFRMYLVAYHLVKLLVVNPKIQPCFIYISGDCFTYLLNQLGRENVSYSIESEKLKMETWTYIYVGYIC